MIINEALRPLLGKYIVIYLDDILIFLESIEKYYKYLKRILSLLSKYKLYI
jgi:hypothetical protein